MKWSYLITSILLLYSCKSDEIPDGVISEHRMTEVLLEVYLSEMEFSELRLHRDTTIILYNKYEKLIFDRQGISKEDYKKSLTYYYNHPERLDRIYEVVLDSLTLQETKIKAKNESMRQKKDSTAVRSK